MKINPILSQRMRALKASAHNLYRNIEDQQVAGWYLVACIAGAAAIILLCVMPVHAQMIPSPTHTDEQIVNAIYKAEGGKKTRFPYGIKSVKCEGEKECRKICLNTVKNNRVRYERQVGDT